MELVWEAWEALPALPDPFEIVGSVEKCAPEWVFAQPLEFAIPYLGWSIHDVNLAFCLLASFPFGVLVRLLPTRCVTLRLCLHIIFGFSLALFLYRLDILVLLFAIAISGVILVFFSRSRYLPYLLISFVFSVLWRVMWVDRFNPVAGALMYVTQKMTSLAFGLSDGLRPLDQLVGEQRRCAVITPPTPLEFLAYLFFVPASLTQGPHVFFVDFRAYMHGTAPRGTVLPCLYAIVKKLSAGAACVLLYRLPGMMNWVSLSTVHLLSNPQWIASHNLAERVGHMLSSFFHIRMFFYINWFPVDAALNAAGYGFVGIRADGSENWDGASNSKIVETEFGISPKMMLDGWHVQTTRWLRYVAYDRSGSLILARVVLAFWHGLDPRYPAIWLSLAIVTIAARRARRNLRPLAMLHPTVHQVYHLVTWFSGIVNGVFCFYPFVAPDITQVLQVWQSVYFYSIILSGSLCLLLPAQGTAPWVTNLLQRWQPHPPPDKEKKE
eukprot:m.159356 g.159356  ORF g.159356 m.159356 type:complete len:495 (-) comp15180_c0_seq4:38-1522(-)